MLSGRWLVAIAWAPIISGLALGVIMGGGIHQLTWRWRQRWPWATAVLGAVSAAGIFAFFGLLLSTPYVGEIHGALRFFWVVLVAVTLVLGLLQARIMRWSLFHSIMGVYLNAGAAFVITFIASTGVRSWMYRSLSDWQWVDLMFNSFVVSLVGVMILLEVIRPLRERKWPGG